MINDDRKKNGNVGVKSVSGTDFRHMGAPTQDKEPVTNSPDPPKAHVFGLCEEVGMPGENLHRHVENMQTPHTKAP